MRRLDAKLEAGDPHLEVTFAWHGYQKLRAVYHVRPERGRRLVAEIVNTFPSCPILEIVCLGRALRRWRSAILAYFDTTGASNGTMEAINGVIETMRRVARDSRSFHIYRLCALDVRLAHLLRQGHPWVPKS
ncbi:transposase [Kocuria rosea]|uniref:transposase n=1 Tax=Kocuria rosea TaxID=1275 RepID=UPI0024093D5D|nr:transposase [Kocuria polaris]